MVQIGLWLLNIFMLCNKKIFYKLLNCCYHDLLHFFCLPFDALNVFVHDFRKDGFSIYFYVLSVNQS